VSDPVRIIVCGSRDWDDRETLDSHLESLRNQAHINFGSRDIVIVHGACPFGGADRLAEEWAIRNLAGFEPHPPKVRGTAGFHARNQAMADAGAWLCVGFTDGRDPERGTWGTGDMFSRALAAGIPVRGVPSRRNR
jgi:hypothetical protein